MKITAVLAALFQISAALASAHAADEQIPFFAGPADLAKMCPVTPTSDAQRLACQNYIVGVVDAMSLVRANEPALSKHLGCVGGSAKPNALPQIVGKYVAENPKSLNKPAVFVVREAIVKAFPCPDQPAAKPQAAPKKQAPAKSPPQPK